MYQPQPPAPPVQTSPKMPWYRRTWGIVVIALLCVGIGGAAAQGAASKKNAADAAPAPTATVTATVTATATRSVVQTKVKTVHVTTTPTKVIATHTRTETVTYTPPPKPAFSDGTYLVGSDIRPGLYRTDGQGGDGTGCYYARLNDLTGAINSIASNNNFDGPTVVQIYPSDRAFEVSGGCQWRRA